LIARGKPKYTRTLLLSLALIALLYFALRNAPFIEIWNTLQHLQLSQIGILLLINAIVIMAMAARWWVIVRAENPSIPFWPLVKYRLAVFGLSYFTPGPQVGGEPLQVFYLQKNHGITFARATSAVIMDKLLEFLANFILIGVGLTAAIRVGMLSANGTQALGSLIPMAAILLWPVIHLIMLYRGRYPVSSLLRAATSLIGNPDWVRLIIVSERMAASFTRRKLPSLLGALFFSMIAWTGMAAEYFLMASFLEVNLSFEQILAALTAALFAFLMPLPGGLGALEASQVYALTSMGYAPAIGISLSLIMRARDMLNGGLGLLLAGKFIRDISR
jgi:uncharacterized protein (TIRG00374 family)